MVVSSTLVLALTNYEDYFGVKQSEILDAQQAKVSQVKVQVGILKELWFY